MKNLNDVVANNIANLRKSKNLTQQELAEKFNYSDKTVSKWELGQAIPSVEVLKQLGDYFGVTVDYFLHDEPEQEKAKYKIKSLPQKQNQIIITVLSSVMVMLMATVVFVWSILNKSFYPTPYWQVFVWMVPAASIIVSLFLFRWFRNHITIRLIFQSIFVWGMLAAVYLHMYTFPSVDPARNIWYIFFIGIPVEIMLVLISKMKR